MFIMPFKFYRRVARIHIYKNWFIFISFETTYLKFGYWYGNTKDAEFVRFKPEEEHRVWNFGFGIITLGIAHYFAH